MSDIEDGELLSSDNEDFNEERPRKHRNGDRQDKNNNKVEKSDLFDHNRKFDNNDKSSEWEDNGKRNRKYKRTYNSRSHLKRRNSDKTYSSDSDAEAKISRRSSPFRDIPKKATLCRYYARSASCVKENCHYMHETFPCKFFHGRSRHCREGSNCKFSHEPLTPEMEKVLQVFISEGRDYKYNDSKISPLKHADNHSKSKLSENENTEITKSPPVKQYEGPPKPNLFPEVEHKTKDRDASPSKQSEIHPKPDLFTERDSNKWERSSPPREAPTEYRQKPILYHEINNIKTKETFKTEVRPRRPGLLPTPPEYIMTKPFPNGPCNDFPPQNLFPDVPPNRPFINGHNFVPRRNLIDKPLQRPFHNPNGFPVANSSVNNIQQQPINCFNDNRTFNSPSIPNFCDISGRKEDLDMRSLYSSDNSFPQPPAVGKPIINNRTQAPARYILNNANKQMEEENFREQIKKLSEVVASNVALKDLSENDPPAQEEQQINKAKIVTEIKPEPVESNAYVPSKPSFDFPTIRIAQNNSVFSMSEDDMNETDRKYLEEMKDIINLEATFKDSIPWSILQLDPVEKLPYALFMLTVNCIHNNPMADPRLYKHPVLFEIDSDTPSQSESNKDRCDDTDDDNASEQSIGECGGAITNDRSYLSSNKFKRKRVM